ncbi:histidine kinase, partial [Streptomyces sp. T-3]|nr:histidine kinase [Streptomyces sp. T-3]
SAARRVLDSNPDFVREALTAIEDTTRRTVGELDAVLGLLREGDESAKAPAPTLADDLEGLLARTRTTGTPVTATVDVEVAALPQLVSREAYRIVQEGLSNALRHAGSSPVTLRIAQVGEELEIVMENPLPRGGAPSATRPGGGNGLKGV